MYIQDELSIDKSVFIAPNTNICGKFTIGENSSIWFQSVLRGDVDEIIIGENSNIQDACVIHCVEGFPTKIGNNVSLGHGVILHGCTLGNNVLVGMRATVLTGAVIGNNCLIGAGALVSENMIIPDNSLVIGIPAEVKKEINESQLDLIYKTSKNYVEYSKQYLKNMKNNLIENLKGKLIVSCQASELEPLYSPEALLAMAKASIEGGAFALRANTPLPIRYMKSFFDIPIIGLYKSVYSDSDVYITPTIKEVDAISVSGAEIIAVDATLRKRPNDEKLEDILKRIQKKHNLLAMADISTYDEAINAEKIGFDLIGTTLSGYTPYSKQSDEPDFELLEKIVKNIKTPVIMEGKIWTPDQLKKAFEIGAYAVVIGSAITRPHLITKKFSEII